MNIFAHRGASGDYPENTILSFEKAIKIGVDGLELDVHKTKDGKLVVIHDEDIERTFKGKGLIKDYTLKELKKFKNRKIEFEKYSKCTIPTLEDIFKILRSNNVLLNIELKNDEIEYEDLEVDVISLIEKYNYQNRILISSFNHKSLWKCKEINSDIKTGLLYYKPIENVVQYGKQFKVDALHPDLKLVSPELIIKAHENNLKVNVYTVNEPRYIRILMKSGVDGIFTDYPALAKEIKEEL